MPLMRVAGGIVRNMNGYKRDQFDHRDLVMAAPASGVVIPSSASLRHLKPTIRDQGPLGSCTANGSTLAMGYLYLKQGKPDPILSRLFTYYYSRKVDGDPINQDTGCQIRSVMKALATYGTPPEAMWPYDVDKFADEPPHNAFKEASDHQVLWYYRCPSLRTIKASIAQGFPVIIGFAVPENVFSATCAATGVVKYPGKTEGFEGGHCVLMDTYDDKKKLCGGPNSWGPHWGDKGYIHLPYQMFEDGYVSDCWTIRREEM